MRPTPIRPEPGQESVWDYPRPPRVEESSRHVRVTCQAVTIADTHRAHRVLETASPPVYYIPPDDVRLDLLQLIPAQHSFCEWKGVASYYELPGDDRRGYAVAWSYPAPSRAFE